MAVGTEPPGWQPTARTTRVVALVPWLWRQVAASHGGAAASCGTGLPVRCHIAHVCSVSARDRRQATAIDPVLPIASSARPGVGQPREAKPHLAPPRSGC